MAKVKATEDNQDCEEIETDEDFHTALAFESNIGGLEAGVILFFVEDKLFAGRYMFIEDHNNENEYFTDFDRIDENLQEKYGSTKVDWDWSNDVFKGLKTFWGEALSEGHLSLSAEWEVSSGTDITEIYHDLYGEDYEIFHRITYYSDELEAHLRDLRKEENVF